MFRGLRLTLTALYMLASVFLIVLIGGATYRLMDSYFQSTTDAALLHKLALELSVRQVPLPPEIVAADRDWYASHGGIAPTGVPATGAVKEDGQEGEQESAGTTENEGADEHELEGAYDGDLAAIFVIPVAADGQVVASGQSTTSSAAPIDVDQGGLNAAIGGRMDWRTIQVNSGRVRLLTYKLPGDDATAALQLGRTLGDQDRVLNRLMLGLVGLSALSMLLLGACSWWLAGRSLRPAQQALEKQQAFVANASHELRTPLTFMRASAEVAMRQLPASDGDNRELLNDVVKECDYMGKLVEDLLLLSRLDAGRLRLERTAVPVQELFSDVSRQMGRAAQERGIHLVAGQASGSMLADPTRLRQVLLILVDNALRHTPDQGTVELAAHREGSQMQISVTDTGKGVAPEHLPHLFERFYHVTEKRSENGSTPGAGRKEADGSGLGLSIAKGLVEAQHGHIWIDSKLRQGTRAVISLPAG